MELSVRGKTVLIIMGIVMFITACALGAGFLVSQYRFSGVVRATLLSASRIAGAMIASEIGRLKEEAEHVAAIVAEHAGGSPGRPELSGQDALEFLEAQLAAMPDYMSFSVFDSSGLIIHAGPEMLVPDDAFNVSGSSAWRAFAGETVIASTSRLASGALVMRVWTSVGGGLVLAATLPGFYLSDFISPFGIWEGSSIFIVDGSGTYVASGHNRGWVETRHGRVGPGGKGDDRLVAEHEAGIEQLELDGRQVLSAFAPIKGTDGWQTAVMASLAESPFSHVMEVLLMSAAMIVVLGIIVAIAAGDVIASPFEKMEVLKSAAEKASVSKTKFLANMSHEMRTPLNAILGLSEMELAGAKLQGDSFSNIEKIHGAGVTLLGIINDLLDVSKIESGHLTLTPVVYDVPDMINDTAQLNIVRLGNKPVQFFLKVSEGLPVRLKGDELKVRRIFNNLLTNAFKYTKSGSVEWDISCRQEGKRVKIISTVQDTGIGIHREDFARLFKDYSQVDDQANYHVEGTGLGLSITKELVTIMGGSISLDSEYMKGSVFTVEFYQEAHGSELIGTDVAANISQFRYSVHRDAKKQRAVRPDMSYARVLVVDDVQSNLEIAKGLMKPYKINVDTAESGREAVELISAGKIHYDAIFMDHMMPVMNGVQAVRIIRSEIDSDYARNVPIIALTANAMAGNETLYTQNGFQAFILKPIDVLRLEEVLDKWVRKEKENVLQNAGEAAAKTGPEKPEPEKAEPENRESDAAVAVKEEPGKAAGSGLFGGQGVPGLDIATGLAIIQNDTDSYLAVLRSFVKHTPQKLNVVKNDAATDLDSYRIAVHGLKGSARGIGAAAAGDLAAALEEAAVHGDTAYINANNAVFVQTVQTLISDIGVFLENVSGDNDGVKPEKKQPERALLQEMLQACRDYDIVAMGKLAKAVSGFTYSQYPDFARWINEQLYVSGFEAMEKRIRAILENPES